MTLSSLTCPPPAVEPIPAAPPTAAAAAASRVASAAVRFIVRPSVLGRSRRGRPTRAASGAGFGGLLLGRLLRGLGLGLSGLLPKLDADVFGEAPGSGLRLVADQDDAVLDGEALLRRGWDA